MSKIAPNKSICVADGNVNKRKLIEQLKEELGDPPKKLANYLYKDKDGKIKTGTTTVE